MIVKEISDLVVGKKYRISQRFGSSLGIFKFVKPEGMPNETSVFFDSVKKGRGGHTAFYEDFQNYVYEEV